MITIKYQTVYDDIYWKALSYIDTYDQIDGQTYDQIWGSTNFYVGTQVQHPRTLIYIEVLYNRSK